jgi:hypothetical protein
MLESYRRSYGRLLQYAKFVGVVNWISIKYFASAIAEAERASYGAKRKQATPRWKSSPSTEHMKRGVIMKNLISAFSWIALK